MTPAGGRRLPAAERREAVLEAAMEEFSESSYAGATTAEIARRAGVSEPILYRHFASKRELYVACLEESWRMFRDAIRAALDEERDPTQWTAAISRAARSFHERPCKVVPTNLWVQAINEAAEDPEIKKAIRRNLKEAHAFFVGVVEEGQARGGIPRDRDASAEAWISLGVGLLRSVADRVGGLLGPEDFKAIADARARWMSGR